MNKGSTRTHWFKFLGEVPPGSSLEGDIRVPYDQDEIEQDAKYRIRSWIDEIRVSLIRAGEITDEYFLRPRVRILDKGAIITSETRERINRGYSIFDLHIHRLVKIIDDVVDKSTIKS